MKINYKIVLSQKALAVILALTLGIVFIMQNMAFAAGSIYFEPGNISAQKGNIVTVKVMANSTEFVAAQIDVSYDASVLEYSSQSLTNSVLPTAFGPAPSNGEAKITLYTTAGAVSGSNLKLISLSFKVLKENTTTTLKFLPTTSLNYQDSKVASGTNQATIVISGTATPTSGGNTSSPTSTTSSTSTNENIATQPPTSLPTSPSILAPETPTVVAPSSDKDAPKIISAVPIGFANGIVSIKITTDEPTTATVKFGEKDNLLNSRNTANYSTSYFVPLAEVESFFSQDKDYYFTAEVIDAAGNKTQSDKIELVVKPVNVTITAKDENGAILANTLIIVNGKEFTTDANGLVTIEGILPGSVAISIKQGDKTIYVGEVTAVKGVKNQTFTVTPKEIITTTKPQYLNYLVPTTVAIIGLAAILFVIKKIKSKRAQDQYAYTTQQPLKPWDPTANIPTRQPSILQRTPTQPTQPTAINQPSSTPQANSGAIITPTINPAPPNQPPASPQQAPQQPVNPNNPQEPPQQPPAGQ